LKNYPLVNALAEENYPAQITKWVNLVDELKRAIVPISSVISAEMKSSNSSPPNSLVRC
jgi:hypothetical protein